MATKPTMKRSEVTNILANAAHARVARAIVTFDEDEGRVTIAIASGRTVHQRFHVFVVEEPS